jgi:hypothetical protein
MKYSLLPINLPMLSQNKLECLSLKNSFGTFQQYSWVKLVHTIKTGPYPQNLDLAQVLARYKPP